MTTLNDYNTDVLTASPSAPMLPPSIDYEAAIGEILEARVDDLCDWIVYHQQRAESRGLRGGQFEIDRNYPDKMDYSSFELNAIVGGYAALQEVITQAYGLIYSICEHNYSTNNDYSHSEFMAELSSGLLNAVGNAKHQAEMDVEVSEAFGLDEKEARRQAQEVEVSHLLKIARNISSILWTLGRIKEDTDNSAITFYEHIMYSMHNPMPLVRHILETSSNPALS